MMHGQKNIKFWRWWQNISPNRLYQHELYNWIVPKRSDKKFKWSPVWKLALVNLKMGRRFLLNEITGRSVSVIFIRQLFLSMKMYVQHVSAKRSSDTCDKL